MNKLAGVVLLSLTVCGFQLVLLMKVPAEFDSTRSRLWTTAGEPGLLPEYSERVSALDMTEVTREMADDPTARPVGGPLSEQPEQSRYQVVSKIAVPGTEGWNQLVVDSDRGRLFITRDTHVTVVDLDSGQVVGDIPDTDGVYGIALASQFNRGFTTNGRANSVTIFDLKTLTTMTTVAIRGKNPHHLVFDPKSQLVFVMNNRSQSITAIKAEDGRVIGNIPVS